MAKLSTLVLLAFLAVAPFGLAQAPARFIGSITAISGNTLTVKPDTGDSRQVEVPGAASLKRIAPGQKDLSTAANLTFADLAVGDRVLVRLNPNAASAQAAQIIVIKQEDLSQKQQKDREDWQRRGIGGLVKSVDAGAGVILVTTGAGATAKTVAVHTSKATVLKRYAPGSVRFDQAQAAPLTAIHPGDQLRARGEKSADGAEIAAEEIVSGTFRNIAGTVTSVDAANSTLVVKDLASKKPVTIHITPDTQLRKIPDRIAQMLAVRLKGGASMTPQGAAQRGRGDASAGSGQFGAPNGAGGDPQQSLNRAPQIQLTDLQKGEAVMVVATDGASDVNAITLLAGVEPLLEAPAASNLLSNWSMSGGAAEGAAGPQ